MDFSSLQEWGYLAIAFFSLGGSMFIVAAAGVFAYLGHLNLTYALLIAAVANFLGDNLLFILGRYQKKELINYLKKHRRKVAATTLLMRKYGDLAIFIQKFIYGIKTLIPLVMGLSKYDLKKFLFFNFFASIIFVLVVGMGSYFFSGFIIKAFGFFSSHPYLAPLFLLTVATLFWLYLKRITKK